MFCSAPKSHCVVSGELASAAIPWKTERKIASSCSHAPLTSQSQLLPLLSPGGKGHYHLRFASGKSWSLGIRLLGLEAWEWGYGKNWDRKLGIKGSRPVFKKLGSEAETGIGGLGMRLCQNWNWKSGNEAMSKTSPTDKIFCRIFPKQNEKLTPT